jgi:hypothetical protein
MRNIGVDLVEYAYMSDGVGSGMVEFHTRRKAAMSDGRPVSVSIRVSPRFQSYPGSCCRSRAGFLTNMIEALLFTYCDEHGVHPN